MCGCIYTCGLERVVDEAGLVGVVHVQHVGHEAAHGGQVGGRVALHVLAHQLQLAPLEVAEVLAHRAPHVLRAHSVARALRHSRLDLPFDGVQLLATYVVFFEVVPELIGDEGGVVVRTEHS